MEKTMKTFTVELWAHQEAGDAKIVTLPDDMSIDPDNRNTLCTLSRFLMKFSNGSKVQDYQGRPLSNGDVVRIGNRRFCMLVGRSKKDDTMDYHVLELGRIP